MPFPSGTNLSNMIGFLRDEFDNLYAQIEGYLRTEHKSDGSHADVTADTVTTTGDVSVGGDLDVGGDTAIVGDLTTQDGGAKLGLHSELSVTDGGGGNGVSFGSGADRLALYSSSEGADDYLKLSFGTVTPLMIRRTSSEYFIQPGPNSKAAATSMNLGGDRNANDRWTAVYVQGGVKEQGRTEYMGHWTAVAHNAANFTASAGTWTVDSGDQITLAYTLVGKTMTVAFTIAGTDVSTTPANLMIAIPGGFSAARRVDGVCIIVDAGGTPEAGACNVNTAGTVIVISKNSGNFTATSSNNTNIAGQLSFEVA